MHFDSIFSMDAANGMKHDQFPECFLMQNRLDVHIQSKCSLPAPISK